MRKYSLLFFFSLFISQWAKSQIWNQSLKAPMPEAVSNQAVCLAFANDTPYVYSFGGIDSTKLFSGIHLRSYCYNVISNTWQALPSLPDTLGKIATAASCVKNKIYIAGGYHVFANSSEITSNKVHVFDPLTQQFLADANPIPVPVDDHVQAVWRDSLIFLITGWSNTTNVPNVQIFNPANNLWQIGTSVPNNNIYKSFGASGTIVGDTIFYYGGASSGFNFPIQNQLRIGIIDPTNPTNINWSNPSSHIPNYRCAVVADAEKRVYFLGGSPQTYNFDGIAFNGSGGIDPNTSSSFIFSDDWQNWQLQPLDLPMDLRGVAQLSPHQIFIAGGMKVNQEVSNELIFLTQDTLTGIKEDLLFKQKIRLFPNPSHQLLSIENLSEIASPIKVTAWNNQGKIIFQSTFTMQIAINIESWLSGVYIIQLQNDNRFFSYKFAKP